MLNKMCLCIAAILAFICLAPILAFAANMHSDVGTSLAEIFKRVTTKLALSGEPCGPD